MRRIRQLAALISTVVTLALVVVPVPGRGGAEAAPLSVTQASLSVGTPEKTPAKPLVETWAMRLVWGGTDEAGTTGTELPLSEPCDQLGLVADENTQRTEVGVVQADGVVGTVFAFCEDPGERSVELAVDGLPWVGRTYMGKITLPAGGTAVELTVARTTAWWIVAGIILVGIAVAWGAIRWRDDRRFVALLRARTFRLERADVPNNVHDADALFRREAQAHGLPENVQRWTIADAVRAELKDLRASLSEDASVSNQTIIETALGALDKQVRAWPATAEQIALLVERLPSLDRLATYQQRIRERTVGRSLTHDKLALGELDDVAAAVREGAQLAYEWPVAAIEGAITRAVGIPQDSPARGELDSVLEQFRVAPDAATARAALDNFWRADAAVRAAATVSKGLFPRPGTGDDEPTPRAAAEPRGAAPEVAARDLAVQIATRDSFVWLVLLAAALIGGLDLFYVGKTFGGTWDLAKALVWGLGSATVTGAVSTAFGNLAQSLRATDAST